MSWAKFDDRYDDTRKVKRAWRDHPRAVGLHAMAITYCCRHETDGLVDLDWIAEKLPDDLERTRVLEVLVELALFHPTPDGDAFVVHDFLDYNPSREQLAAERQAKADAGRKGGSAPRSAPKRRKLEAAA